MLLEHCVMPYNAKYNAGIIRWTLARSRLHREGIKGSSIKSTIINVNKNKMAEAIGWATSAMRLTNAKWTWRIADQ